MMSHVVMKDSVHAVMFVLPGNYPLTGFSPNNSQNANRDN